jgi:hypothetical protein
VISLRIVLDEALCRALLTGRTVRLADAKSGGAFELQMMLHGNGLAELLSAAAAAVAIPENGSKTGRKRVEANANSSAPPPVKIVASAA